MYKLHTVSYWPSAKAVLGEYRLEVWASEVCSRKSTEGRYSPRKVPNILGQLCDRISVSPLPIKKYCHIMLLKVFQDLLLLKFALFSLFLIPGVEFESRIRQNEINNPKFNFLNPGDPYNAYFQHKVQDFRDQDAKGRHAIQCNVKKKEREKAKVHHTINSLWFWWLEWEFIRTKHVLSVYKRHKLKGGGQCVSTVTSW